MNRDESSRWVALCLHEVTPDERAEGGGPGRFSTSRQSFEVLLDAIEAAGMKGCSIAHALARPGEPRVAITFDDGTRGDYEQAFPALRARGMTATFYVTTDWVGRPGHVTWSELREMKAAGMSVQSHSRTHPFLSELSAADLRAELAASKSAIDRELAQQTDELAFPGGNAPRRALRSIASEEGYRVLVGSMWGVNDDAHPERILRRCTVRGRLDAEWARRVIEGSKSLRLRNEPREALLRSMRSAIGPSRYARWRRRLLDAVALRRRG